MKNPLFMFIFMFFLTAFASSTFAASESCMQLMNKCQAQKKLSESDASPDSYTDLMDGSYCLGYFEGFSDAMAGASTSSFCLPGNLTTAQLAIVYVVWADHHPEKSQSEAGFCVASAFKDKFPCPTGK